MNIRWETVNVLVDCRYYYYYHIWFSATYLLTKFLLYLFFSDKLGAQRTLTGSEIYQTNHVPHGNISLFIVIVFLC